MLINPMGMNPMGMNPMGMNPMGINPMGINPIGMNNQMNSIGVDQTTINIKNIVKPYEDKIKELEETIRKKDFEITVLKQKLNHQNSNINFMNMGVNQMIPNPNMNSMFIGENFNEILGDKGNEIYLIIKTENNELNIKCFEKDKISVLRDKYKIIDGVLIFNYRVLSNKLSFMDYDITNSSIIQVKSLESASPINLIFTDSKGFRCNIALSKDCPLNIALFNFFLYKKDIFELIYLLMGRSKVIFTYNAEKLSIRDETPIHIFFKSPNPRIIVSYI